MEKIYDSRFVEIYFDKEKKLIEQKFLEATEDMETSDFKEEMFNFVKHVKDLQPVAEIVNLLDMQFVIDPDMQEWMNKEVFPSYVDIIKRLAFLVSKDFLAQVAVEQTMNEETGQQFESSYFSDKSEAIEWLLENE